MDNLEWRKNKPPVNFCAIYAMDIKTKKDWETLDDIKKLNVRIGIKMSFTNGRLNTDTKIFKNKKDYINWLNLINSDNNEYLSLDLETENNSEKLIIVCSPDQILNKEPRYEKKRNVGLLVSTMQKLIRRGPKCSKVLYDVLYELWKSPGYNLPEQQFLRVNACRQLVWRLLITSIEDVRAFNNKSKDLLSMNDLAALSILANGYPELQFNEDIFEKILLTALSVQNINKKWDLLEQSSKLQDEIPLKDTNDQLLNSFTALYYYMPLRRWDSTLLKFSYNYIQKDINKIIIIDPTNIEYFLNKANDKSGLDGLLAGMDMHPYPNILIIFQGSLPFLPHDPEIHTTRNLWHFIWDYSSGLNYRLKSPLDDLQNQGKILVNILKNIQYVLLFSDDNIDNDDNNKIKKYINIYINTDKHINNKKNIDDDKIENKSNNISPLIKRMAFILLFGKKRIHYYKNKRYEIIIAGYDNNIDDNEIDKEYCKVKTILKNEAKYIEGELRKEIELDFLNNFEDLIESPQAPPGYKWLWNDKKQILIKSEVTKLNKIIFYVDGIRIDAYDASNILVELAKIIPIKMPDVFKNIIHRTLYLKTTNKELDKFDDYDINLLLRKIHELFYNQQQNRLTFKWLPLAKKAKFPTNLWRSIYIKLYNNKNNEVLIGPVDGQGNSLRDSINYLYEGTIWRIFNMFSMLYPHTIIITRAEKSLKFQINTNTSQYIDLINNLRLLMTHDEEKEKKYSEEIKIKTKLWEHQDKTKNKILKDIFTLGRRGFGDASNVGAGKTLTALSIMAELYNNYFSTYAYSSKLNLYSGFLVLLPTTYLYKTWQDEIEKHCDGFHMVFQNANGTLTSELQFNSILITTLGRMRDHPLNEMWLFVVIDECLSVQNKNALQTEEAWRQIITSKYGVLMASATFFRTRFDKLFYMIKMLNSGLPETKEYLDAILAESIVSNIPIKTREWIVSYNPFKLSKMVRNEYNAILGKDLASDKLYIKLQSFLFDNFNYISAFETIIRRVEKENRRCLIYSRSKEEADNISDEIDGVSRFPDISGKHLVLSYVEGTFGLNNLVYLDTIVTRFPEPDKLPQMKGRLDRPNQKKERLYIEYIYIDGTIDRAGMLRLEMANRFYNDYIMPLAEYYEIAVGRKNIKKKNIKK